MHSTDDTDDTDKVPTAWTDRSRSRDVLALIASDDRAEHIAAGRGSHKPKSHEGPCRIPSGVEHMTRQGREQHNGMVSSRIQLEVNRSHRSHRGRKDSGLRREIQANKHSESVIQNETQVHKPK